MLSLNQTDVPGNPPTQLEVAWGAEKLAMHSTASGRALLALEAKRLRNAFMYDPVIAMNVSKVDPLPHQIEAVYGYVLRQSRIRFMLAHDPGAGKTIMAGLIIKELKMRGSVKRVLIVVPGQLKEQWRWEMKDKVDEDFEVVDRGYFNAGNSGCAWDGDQLITSIDFAKKNDVVRSMKNARFDLIIVDEAHKMSAYSYGKATSKTMRYRLGEALSGMSRHLLFLTATPHKGDSENFRLLLDLLEPGFFARKGMIEESIKNQDNPLFLRRAKEGMTSFDGAPLFMPRSVHTPDIRLSPPEKKLYAAMSKYVKEQYNLASGSSRGHNVTFALIILQRRFASSPFALLNSLRRRKARLAGLANGGGGGGAQDQTDGVPASMDGAEEMSEADRWALEGKWELLSAAQNAAQLREEIATIDGLVASAEKVLKKGTETKLAQLKETLLELDKSQPGEKVLVFTESKDTMNYLVGNIRRWGYSVNTIHGSMPSLERKNAEAVFRDQTRVMVATEAAGEGINLQFCHLMINYDLPWNPNRLEQRMGRVHRYGQKHPVLVFNLVASDTREGEIMRRLFEKLDEIKASMGSDKIFDVISEVVPGKSLSAMLLDATVRNRMQKTIIAELDVSVSAQNSKIRDYLKDGLAVKYMDHTAFADIREKAKEGSLVPEYTSEFFTHAVRASGGTVSESGGALSVILPPGIRGIACDKYGMNGQSGQVAATFDKDVVKANPGVELVTLGHPAFDAALDWAEAEYSGDVLSGAVFSDPAGRMDGYMVYCQSDVVDGTGNLAGRQVSAFFVDGSGRQARKVLPAMLLDLEPSPGEPAGPAPQHVIDAAVSESTKTLDAYVGQIAKQRSKHADKVQRYGTESLDSVLDGISDDIMRLLAKKHSGVNVDLAIHNKRRDREKYRKARMALGDRTASEGSLHAGAPLVIGCVRVVPNPAGPRAAESAIKSALEYEKASGRTPEDCSGTGRGFDIKSTGYGGVRYIVAKPAGAVISMTPNEWMRSRTLMADSYLYIVGESGKIMRRVANPAFSILETKTRRGSSP